MFEEQFLIPKKDEETPQNEQPKDNDFSGFTFAVPNSTFTVGTNSPRRNLSFLPKPELKQCAADPPVCLLPDLQEWSTNSSYADIEHELDEKKSADQSESSESSKEEDNVSSESEGDESEKTQETWSDYTTESDISDDEEPEEKESVIQVRKVEAMGKIESIKEDGEVVGGLQKRTIIDLARQFEGTSKHLVTHLNTSWEFSKEARKLTDMIVLSVKAGEREMLRNLIIDAISAEHEQIVAESSEAIFTLHHIDSKIQKLTSIPIQVKNDYLRKKSREQKKDKVNKWSFLVGFTRVFLYATAGAVISYNVLSN